ncbi:MAG: SulP family inorganic anion transporter [Candidatus Limnocylindrales bacterium]
MVSALVGELPAGLPALALPALSPADVTELVPIVVPIFLVTLAQTAATSRGFAAAGGYDVRIDRDFVAVGAGSLLSGLSGGFAVNASPTCTATVAAVGGRSQAANLVAAGVVGAVLLLATGVLANLPEVTLGGILVAVGVKLVQWRDLAAVARYSRPEWVIALITLTVVALVGIQQGIYLAIALALGRRAYLWARPGDSLLGRLSGVEGVWVSRHHYPEASVPAGLCVFRYDAPLFYANAQHFADRLRAVIRESGEPVRAVVVEAVGIDDLDFTGAKVLAEIDTELAGQGTTLALAHPFGRLGTELTAGSLAQRFRGRVFNSVDDAVAGLLGVGGAALRGEASPATGTTAAPTKA